MTHGRGHMEMDTRNWTLGNGTPGHEHIDMETLTWTDGHGHMETDT